MTARKKPAPIVFERVVEYGGRVAHLRRSPLWLALCGWHLGSRMRPANETLRACNRCAKKRDQLDRAAGAA